MPNPAWGFETTDDEVASAFKDHIKGKVVLITGVSPNSLGADYARAIASYSPALIILASRTLSKIKETEADLLKVNPALKTRTLELDLGSQKATRKAAEEVNAYPENIDILMNNAGVMACPYSKTVDGLETQFVLAAGKGARIINVSSSGHQMGGVRFEDPNFENGDYHKWTAYGQAKTANILFSISLAEKFGSKGLYSFSVHPGPIKTNLGRHLDEEDYSMLTNVIPQYKTLAQGSATHVVASFDPDILESNGAFMQDCQVSEVAEKAKVYATKETGNQERLWKLSEKIVGETFDNEGNSSKI